VAVSSGSGAHLAWITINGQNFPLENGSVQRAATRKSGGFNGTIPLWYPGAEQTLANLGDNTASVSVQTRGQQATLITGEVDMTDFDYVGGVVSISGRDVSAKLHAVKSAEKWVNKKPHEIIQDLAGRAGIQTNIDPSTLFAGRFIETDWAKLTDGVSYANVIHKLCELMGAHWYVDKNGTLNVKSTQSSVAPYIINFSRVNGESVSDALALHVRRNVQAGKGIKVTINSWNEHEKKAFVGSYTVGGNGTTQNYAHHIPGLNQDHVNQHAKSKASDHSRHEIDVEVELVGDPSITVDQPLQLTGTAFAQTLTIDSIEDSFGMRGHTMRISAKSAKQGRAGTTSSVSGGDGGFDGP
jgi:hypothetical protein